MHLPIRTILCLLAVLGLPASAQISGAPGSSSIEAHAPTNETRNRLEAGIRSGTVLLSAMLQSGSNSITTNHPFPGVTQITEIRTNPPTRLYVALVNLSDANINVRVAPGGPDPDGPGPWQTTLMMPTRIAACEHFDLVVNGDFFQARGIKDAEGTNSGYRAEAWSRVLGAAVTDGTIWSSSASNRPCLVVHKNHALTIEPRSVPGPDDWEVIAGNTLLVTNGVAVPQKSKVRHPRTAVGLDASGRRLVILVADGRKPGIAIGLTYDELAAELLRLGCRDALNLDGGGSSVMALRDSAKGELKILNQPTDGHERPVANALGITVEKP